MAPKIIVAACLLCLAGPAAAGSWMQSPADPYSGYGTMQPHFGNRGGAAKVSPGNGLSTAIDNGAQLDPYYRCVHAHGGTAAAMAGCQPGTGAWNPKGTPTWPFNAR